MPLTAPLSFLPWKQKAGERRPNFHDGLKTLPPPFTVWSLNKSSLLWQSTFRPRLAANRQILPLAVSVYLNWCSCSWQSRWLPESFYLQGSIQPRSGSPWKSVLLSTFSTPGSINLYWICSMWNTGLGVSWSKKNKIRVWVCSSKTTRSSF